MRMIGVLVVVAAVFATGIWYLRHRATTLRRSRRDAVRRSQLKAWNDRTGQPDPPRD